jgi:hypothetical protein
MDIVLSTRLPQRLPHLCASRFSALTRSAPPLATAGRNTPCRTLLITPLWNAQIGFFAVDFTYTVTSYTEAVSRSWARLPRIARGSTRIVPTNSQRHADLPPHSIAVHVRTRGLTHGHIECILTASDLFREEHDGKAIGGTDTQR